MKELEIKHQSYKTIIKREQLISIISTLKTCFDFGQLTILGIQP